MQASQRNTTRRRIPRRGSISRGPVWCLVACLAAPPALARAAACPGDCDGSGAVRVHELVLGVDIALGNRAAAECPALDTDGDGDVRVAELVGAVGAALHGCSEPSRFPIGAYFWPDHAWGQTGRALGDLAELGLSMVVAYYEYVKPDVPPFSGQPDCRGLVREAEADGIDFFIGGPDGGLLRPLDDAALRSRLQATVDCTGASPRYRGWMIDEPELIGYDAALMERVRGTLRGIDPNGRLWVNFHPDATDDQVRQLGQGADIVGADIYPIREGDGSGLPNRPLTDVGRLTRRIRALAPDRVRVWMIVQAFGYSDLPAEGGRGRRPTPEELRFMVYDALAGGADGIVFFGSHQLRGTIPLDAPLWNLGVRGLAGELAQLGPTLLAGERSGGVVAEPEGVDAFAVRAPGEEIVVARNTTGAAVAAVLRFDEDLADAIEIFTARRPSRDGRVLRDDLAPLGVAVYRITR